MPLPKKSQPEQPGKPDKETSGRKPWKKKTPADIIADQADKLRAEIAEAEGQLSNLRGQLEKLEQAKKLFQVE